MMKFDTKITLCILLTYIVTIYFVQEGEAGHVGTFTRYTRRCEGKYICECGDNCTYVCIRQCIDKRRMCDGHADCPNGDDEACCAQDICTDSAFKPRNTRTYYLRAAEIEWDYLPTGANIVDDQLDYLNDTLVNGDNRVGSKYWKYVYQLFTDGTYTTEIPKPVHQGFLGPLLYAEVGERVEINLRNDVDVPVSAHPHGIRYTKANEGAFYTDNTSGDDKLDDGIPPGQELLLTWELTGDFALTPDDPNCLPFAYHSHVSTVQEVNAGLVGLLIVCKPGILSPDGRRTDVDKEFTLYFDSINEGESWLTAKNLLRCGNVTECQNLFDTADPDFEESLKKDAINGYMFGNLPGLDVCVGQNVVWYLFSLEAELHPVHIHGHTFVRNNHRSAVIGLWSATFKTATTVSAYPGIWMISCLNWEHNTNGMRAFLNVTTCAEYSLNWTLSGTTRNYFLQVKSSHEWNYAPSGLNLYDGGNLTAPGSDSAVFFDTSSDGMLEDRIGGTYCKSKFVQYTDSTFSTPMSSPDHLGMLGPVIRAEVGDTINVTLTAPGLTADLVSLYLQGVVMDKSQDGTWQKIPIAPYDTMDGHVTASSVISYVFEVPSFVGPMDDDPPCLVYMYYSAVDFDREVNSGLVGPLLICKQGALDDNGNQKDIDREFFLFFSAVDENLSWYSDTNYNKFTSGGALIDDDYIQSNIMHSINGRSYGNLEGLEMCQGDRVMWHVMSLGQGEGLHGVTWNGNNLMIGGINRDSHVTISGLTFSGMMNADNVGNWSISCHNNHHFESGMKAIYSVQSCGNGTGETFFPWNTVTRNYYIAAVEIDWNFSPNTIHPLTGEDYSNPSSSEYNRVRTDGTFIGSVYKKAVYREFTDSTFAQQKARGADELHLGILGPFIHAEEGDEVRVVFKNMATRNYSIHPMGLKYTKDDEGMKYQDGAPDSSGDCVQPGATFEYTWTVPASAAPKDSGPNCVGSIYHSAVYPVQDMYSGLAGPLVVCKPGTLDANGARLDSVEREFAILFEAFDENQSWYFDENANLTALNIIGVTDDFIESNKYDSINGLIYNNVEGLVMNQGDNVAWYVLGLGTSEDIHTAHFHGQMFTYRSGTAHIGDVIEVFPGTAETVEMYTENPGTWLLHCHVGEHLRDGMVATYTIQAQP